MLQRHICCGTWPLFFLAFLLTGVLNAGHAQSHEDDVEAAKQAAQEWLTLLDADQFEATWKEAAASFRTEIATPEQWASQVRSVHSSLDSLRDRSLAAARYTTSLPNPNVPEGEYVVTQYRAQYGATEYAETVILTREEDAWRVIGYFIKPV